MSQHRPPAGWYDDPAGAGGRRYWDGQRWTDRFEDGGRPGARGRDRLPDGYMMLNGRQVPLGQMSAPASAEHRTIGRGPIVGAAVAVTLVLLLVASSLLASNEEVDLGDWSGDGGALHTIEVDSRDGTAVDVEWYDGTEWYRETAVDPGWSTDLAADAGAIYVQATPNDGRDVATCRIIDADGSVLVETSAAFPGGIATCRWEP